MAISKKKKKKPRRQHSFIVFYFNLVWLKKQIHQDAQILAPKKKTPLPSHDSLGDWNMQENA